MEKQKIRILLVEDNKDFAKLVQVYLQRFEVDRFDVVWKENHAEAMKHLENDPAIDIVLLDYFLPGKTGLDIARELSEKYSRIPVVFLTVNKDFNLVLEVMKLGAAEFLVKDEISSPALPKTIMNVIATQSLKNKLTGLEISRQRLRAIRETLNGVIDDFERPLGEMKEVTEKLKNQPEGSVPGNYVKMINDNLVRIFDKLNRLKSLKEDKTVRYIKDIKMLDLS